MAREALARHSALGVLLTSIDMPQRLSFDKLASSRGFIAPRVTAADHTAQTIDFIKVDLSVVHANHLFRLET